VTETTAPIAENNRMSTAARIGWAVLIVATLYVCYFSHLGTIGFVGPDEPRYAWIARDMAESGDWVTPRLYGKPWFEKPPLFYWGAAVSFKWFGVSEAAARLPSAISALLVTFALAWLALRLYGAETARWLLLLLPTTVGMIGFSHAAATDMPFSGMLTIAMVCAAVVLGLTRGENTPILPRTPWLALLLFGFFLGLAVLAKGPAAIILSGGAVFFWALFTKRWHDAFRLFHPVALASFCLTALPWYIACARRNPDFFLIFIIEHNIKRYLTPEFQHIQPFWFYAPVLLVAFLPWTALFVWSFIEGAHRLWKTRDTDEATCLLICWATFCVIFFSVSQSKLPGYTLPALPALSLLMARDLSRRLKRGHSSLRWLCLAIAMTFTVLGVIVGRAGEKIPFVMYSRPAPAVLKFYELTVVASIVLASLAVFRRFRLALALSAGVFPAFLLLAGGDLRQLDEGVSARSTAVYTRTYIYDPRLEDLSTYKLSRSFDFALNYYFHRELAEWSASGGRRSIIFTSPKGSEVLRMGNDCLHANPNSAVVICAHAIRLYTLVKSLPSRGDAQ
jgi:4-amino-4-deoxy-L-arabinose transferase-like glycosyltransferase